MLLSLTLIGVQAASTPSALAQVPEQNVLVVIVEGSYGYYADGENIKNALLQLGVDASSVRASQRGDVAAALSASVYEQIWVYDLGGGVNDYEADWQAIAAWFNEAPSRPIICDGRIIFPIGREDGKMKEKCSLRTIMKT